MPKKLTEELTSIPGIGKSIAKDLTDLGIKQTSNLVGKDPEVLYEKLCSLRGTHIDRCVLYTFRCAVYSASEKHPSARLLLWWNWKDQ